ncbi:btb poz domain containing protein [Diplodia corticola]|uniref:Btb poz domain containing protein n=1 Tax=Diplodia corticola TaxID=236234 RepID=A0A1J9RZ16_9PEZI|nr:btb poz domain containing protein [Diplodia corticola]OJD37915.1 btb poz domain containing protein [Diplodia corticola]
MAAPDRARLGDEPESPAPARSDPPTGPVKFKPLAVRHGHDPMTCFAGPSILIVVGGPPLGEPMRFCVQEALICRYSALFHTELKESETKTFKFPEDHPSTFLRCMFWLYTGEINFGHGEATWDSLTNKLEEAYQTQVKDDEDHGDEGNSGNGDTEGPSMSILTDLWILGYRLQMPALQNAVTRTIFGLLRHNPDRVRICLDATTINNVYVCTPPDVPLRSLIIDMALLIEHHDNLCRITEVATPEIVSDMAKRAFYFMKKARPNYLTPYERLQKLWRRYAVGLVRREDLFEQDAKDT